MGRKGAEIWAKQLGLQPVMDCRTASQETEGTKKNCSTEGRGENPNYGLDFNPK